MQQLEKIINNFITFISLVTALGVFVHDGRVDRAAVTSLNRAPLTHAGDTVTARVKSFMATDAHTHPDHNAARGSLLNSFAYQSPSVPPRKEDRHSSSILDYVDGGRHAFDNTNLPIVA